MEKFLTPRQSLGSLASMRKGYFKNFFQLGD
jgi:hypothetical protein